MNDAPNPAARIRLHESWKQRLLPELLSPQMQALREFLRSEMAAGKEIYPPPKLIFNALDHTPFERVKVMILGQDPYHGPGQAQGLCFSVPPGVEVPPSLVNIYAELKRDLGIEPPGHGCLVPWAVRGVLLLNAVLTVERGRAGSHQGKGNNDFAHDIAISDSGYFVVGQTFSEDGDVSSYKDNGDGWLIAVDDTGSLLNEKARGGSSEDIYTDVLPVTSGGFLLGGYSFSNDGNVSGLNHGGSDGWLVKVSKSGNFQWTECYGSTGDDGISEITESTSGNYVMSVWLTNETDQNSWIFTTDINGVQLSGFDQGGTAVEYGGPLFVNPATGLSVSLQQHQLFPETLPAI